MSAPHKETQALRVAHHHPPPCFSQNCMDHAWTSCIGAQFGALVRSMRTSLVIAPPRRVPSRREQCSQHCRLRAPSFSLRGHTQKAKAEQSQGNRTDLHDVVAKARLSNKPNADGLYTLARSSGAARPASYFCRPKLIRISFCPTSPKQASQRSRTRSLWRQAVF